MFGLLATCYLFLGGAGAGALVVLSVLECSRTVCARDAAGHMRGSARCEPAELADSAHRLARTLAGPARTLARRLTLPDDVFVRAWPLCFAVLALAALCLLCDVGRPDRVLGLLTHPRFSALSVGAYALLIALTCAVAFSACVLLDDVRFRALVVYCLAAIGIISGGAVAVYTGVLLQSFASVLFYQTPLLPMLFALSSLSCGIACVFLGAAFAESRWPFVRPLVHLARADEVLIVLEAVCLVLYLAVMLAGGGTSFAAYALVAGDFAGVFWFGLATVGLCIPFVLELFITHGNSRTQLLWVAACVLAGGFALRWCVVGASAYDITQMPQALYGWNAMLG